MKFTYAFLLLSTFASSVYAAEAGEGASAAGHGESKLLCTANKKMNVIFFNGDFKTKGNGLEKDSPQNISLPGQFKALTKVKLKVVDEEYENYEEEITFNPPLSIVETTMALFFNAHKDNIGALTTNADGDETLFAICSVKTVKAIAQQMSDFKNA